MSPKGDGYGKKSRQRKDYTEPYKYDDLVICHPKEQIFQVKGGSVSGQQAHKCPKQIKVRGDTV